VTCAAPRAAAPAVAAIGSDYFVVWQENTEGNGIRGTRLTHDGLITDTNTLVLGTNGQPQSPAVAASGNRYLVVWQASARTNFTAPTNIFGTIVPSSGPAASLSNLLVISQATTNQVLPAVAGNGTNFFVVWQDLRIKRAFPGNVFGTPVNLEGNSLNRNGIAIGPLSANAQGDPAVAFDGKNYLAVWSDSRNSTSSDIYGARISPDGLVLDPNGIAICTATNSQFSVAIAANPGIFFAVWVDFRNAIFGTPGDIFGARITDAGAVLDTNNITICTIPTFQTAPAVAAGSNDFLVVWVNQRTNVDGANLLATRVGTNGDVVSPNGTALTPDNVDVGQGYPAVAFNGSEYLVIWSDARRINITGYDILGLRLNQFGAPIDSAPLTICSRFGYDTNPALASNGTDFLAVWTDVTNNSAIYAARVAASGRVLDPDGFPLDNSSGGDYPAVASDGTGYLVLWQQAGDIRGTRLSTSGEVLDAPSLSIDTNALSQALPALAYGPFGQFLAVNQGTMFNTPRTVGEFVTLQTNRPPVALARISPLFSILPGDTNLYVLSADGLSATVLFDGSQSYDEDNQSLNFRWYMDGQTNAAGTGILLTNMLSVGLHSVQLIVSDGITSSDIELTFEIISPAIAVEQLFLLVAETDTVTKSQRPLLASLAAAAASFEAGSYQAGLNQLENFQKKNQVQIFPSDPALASRYAAATTTLVDKVSGR